MSTEHAFVQPVFLEMLKLFPNIARPLQILHMKPQRLSCKLISLRVITQKTIYKSLLIVFPKS